MQEDLLAEFERPAYVYAPFWYRFGGLMIDGIVLSILTVGLNLYNLVVIKSFPIQLLILLVSLVYRPFMEYRYQATLGKMAVKIKVVGYDGEAPGLGNILGRNIFHIALSILSLAFAVLLFYSPNFGQAASLMETLRIQGTVTNSKLYSPLTSLIYVVDAIFLWSDSQNRSLHDRIGKTLVVMSR